MRGIVEKAAERHMPRGFWQIAVERSIGQHLRFGVVRRGRCRSRRATVIVSGARVWMAIGPTDMRKGMQGQALLAQ